MQDLILIPVLSSDGAVWRRTILHLDGKANCLWGYPLRRQPPCNGATCFRDCSRNLGACSCLYGRHGSARDDAGSTCARHVPCSCRHPRTAGHFRAKALSPSRESTGYDGRLSALIRVQHTILIHASAGADVHAELVEMSLRVGAATYIRQNRAVVARADLRPGLHQIAIPMAVVVGAEDRLTPVKLSHEIHALIDGSTFHILDSRGHLPLIEKPEAMAGILLDLLRRTAV